MRPPALFVLYQIAASLVLPFAARSTIARLRKAGVPIERTHERLGHATQPRRLGPLMWFHAASVGEAKSVLRLISCLADAATERRFVLTTGTATAAQAVARHMPPRAIHQFAPLDGIGPMTRFLDHWRPDLCVLAESELWPNLLNICARRAIPVALVNARLSDQSAQNWQRAPKTARYVARAVRYAHCQDTGTRDHLKALGVATTTVGQNLKAFITPPQVDPAARESAFAALAGRPVWVAASTHPGEEEGLIAAHKALLDKHPTLCLVLVPRHPDRAKDLPERIMDAGLSVARRSTGGMLSAGTHIYLADTIGETDLWYTLSPIAFLGGSWTDVGGHSPFEAASAHTAILHGPNYKNFSITYETFLTQDASLEVDNSTALAEAIDMLLTHPSRAAQLAANARPFARKNDAMLAQLTEDLLNLAGLEPAQDRD